MDQALLRLADVTRVVGVSRSTIYLMISRGEFPRPVKISARTSRWRASDIEKWVEGLAAGKS